MLKIDLLEACGVATLDRVPVERLKGKTILVTGASGLIGTQFMYGLDHAQKAQGVPMTVYGLAGENVPEHLQPLADRKTARLLVGDLTDDAFVASLPKADAIVHAATYAQPGLFLAHPEVTIKLNTAVPQTLLERNLNADGLFLFISSSEVYSGLTASPFAENQIGTTTPGHPRACYIESKRCGEALVNAFRAKGLRAVSARLSLAYGPGTRAGDKRALHSFIDKALQNGEIRLMDAGTARRTYCYVSDAVNMMWRVLLDGKESVYNVGGVSATTIGGIAALAGEILNVPVVIPKEGSTGLAGAPEDVRLDLSRYEKEFGKRRFVGLDEGVRATIDWQRSLYSRA